MIGAFFLLHFGIWGTWDVLREASTACPMDLDPGWFEREIDHVHYRRSYTKAEKTSTFKHWGREGEQRQPTRKLRSVEAFLQDFHEHVGPNMARYIMVKDGCYANAGEAVFNPVDNPGPLLPAEPQRQAFGRIFNLIVTQRRQRLIPKNDAPFRSLLQQYLLQPTEARYSAVETALAVLVPTAGTAGNPAVGKTSGAKICDLQLEHLPHSSTAVIPALTSAETAYEAAEIRRLAPIWYVSADETRGRRTANAHLMMRLAAITGTSATERHDTAMQSLKKSLLYKDYDAISAVPGNGAKKPFGYNFMKAGSRAAVARAVDSLLKEIYIRELKFERGEAHSRLSRSDTSATRKKRIRVAAASYIKEQGLKTHPEVVRAER